MQVAITRAACADSCGAVGAAALSRITQLNLDGGAWLTPIASLKAGDFDGLASLRWLDLHGNRLQSVNAASAVRSQGRGWRSVIAIARCAANRGRSRERFGCFGSTTSRARRCSGPAWRLMAAGAPSWAMVTAQPTRPLSPE